MTYSDVGGCKEQIEKLREVVEIPLLHVGNIYFFVCRMIMAGSGRDSHKFSLLFLS